MKTRPLSPSLLKHGPIVAFLCRLKKKNSGFVGIKELGFIFPSHPLAVCGRPGQQRVFLGVSRPRADWGRKLNQIKGNERRRGANREDSREWIFSRCGDWGRIKGRGPPAALELFIGLRGPDGPGSDGPLWIAPSRAAGVHSAGEMRRMAARLEIV